MKHLVFVFLLPFFTSAQNVQPLIARGEQVFNQTCANGYCHAVKGAGGGAAPRLVARGFDEPYIARVVMSGIPGTAMGAFASQLPAADLSAVIAYVDTLNGVTPSVNPAGRGSLQAPVAIKTAALAPEAEKGKALFFEATLGYGRCSVCHQADNLGLPVASPITNIPSNAAALKVLKTPHVSTAVAGGQNMPVLILSQGSKKTVFYDLTAVPPVYRVVDSTQVKISPGSSWNHASVIHAYDDPGLESILSFLRGVVRTQAPN